MDMSCSCCTKSAPILLVYVSLLLSIISGAGLATLARLKWDPSTYLIVRGLFPTEYRVLAGVLLYATIVMIVLAHLAVLALCMRRAIYHGWRLAILFTYSSLMASLIIMELVTVWWLCRRITKWLNTSEARIVLHLLLEAKHWSPTIKGLIGFASNFYEPLQIIHNSMDEIMTDLPYNLYVGIAFVAAVAIIQPLAILLAVNAAKNRHCPYSNKIQGKRITGKNSNLATITYNK